MRWWWVPAVAALVVVPGCSGGERASDAGGSGSSEPSAAAVDAAGLQRGSELDGEWVFESTLWSAAEAWLIIEDGVPSRWSDGCMVYGADVESFEVSAECAGLEAAEIAASMQAEEPRLRLDGLRLEIETSAGSGWLRSRSIVPRSEVAFARELIGTDPQSAGPFSTFDGSQVVSTCPAATNGGWLPDGATATAHVTALDGIEALTTHAVVVSGTSDDAVVEAALHAELVGCRESGVEWALVTPTALEDATTLMSVELAPSGRSDAATAVTLLSRGNAYVLVVGAVGSTTQPGAWDRTVVKSAERLTTVFERQVDRRSARWTWLDDMVLVHPLSQPEFLGSWRLVEPQTDSDFAFHIGITETGVSFDDGCNGSSTYREDGRWLTASTLVLCSEIPGWAPGPGIDLEAVARLEGSLLVVTSLGVDYIFEAAEIPPRWTPPARGSAEALLTTFSLPEFQGEWIAPRPFRLGVPIGVEIGPDAVSWNDGCTSFSVIRGSDVVDEEPSGDWCQGGFTESSAMEFVMVEGVDVRVDADVLTISGHGRKLELVRAQLAEAVHERVRSVATAPLGVEADPTGHPTPIGIVSLEPSCSTTFYSNWGLPGADRTSLAPLKDPLLGVDRFWHTFTDPDRDDTYPRQIAGFLEDCARQEGGWVDVELRQGEYDDSVEFFYARAGRREHDEDRNGRPTTEPQTRTTVYVVLRVEPVLVALTVIHSDDTMPIEAHEFIEQSVRKAQEYVDALEEWDRLLAMAPN